MEETEEKYPKWIAIKENGVPYFIMTTGPDENDELWDQKFKDVREFSEGLASVEMPDGSGWTYVDETGKLMKERFLDAYSFKDGFGRVFLGKDHPDYGSKAYVYKNGKAYVDKNGKAFAYQKLEDAKLAKEIYYAPEKFLDIPTEMFRTKKDIVSGLVKEVRRSLVDSTMEKDDVNEEYVAYCTELLTSCKEKVEREETKIKNSDKMKSDLIETIKSFEI